MFRDFTKYEVFENGQIWSYSHKKFLKPVTKKNGYQQVCLYDNEGIKKMYYLHRVVYEAVSGEPIPEGMQCNHISEEKTDCRFENLNLLTPKDNTNYGSRNERAAKTMTNGVRSKQVGAFKNDELVMVFPSTAEAGRLGFDKSNVSACCRGKLKTYKGYNWRYL